MADGSGDLEALDELTDEDLDLDAPLPDEEVEHALAVVHHNHDEELVEDVVDATTAANNAAGDAFDQHGLSISVDELQDIVNNLMNELPSSSNAPQGMMTRGASRLLQAINSLEGQEGSSKENDKDDEKDKKDEDKGDKKKK